MSLRACSGEVPGGVLRVHPTRAASTARPHVRLGADHQPRGPGTVVVLVLARLVAGEAVRAEHRPLDQAAASAASPRGKPPAKRPGASSRPADRDHPRPPARPRRPIPPPGPDRPPVAAARRRGSPPRAGACPWLRRTPRARPPGLPPCRPRTTQCDRVGVDVRWRSGGGLDLHLAAHDNPILRLHHPRHEPGAPTSDAQDSDPFLRPHADRQARRRTLLARRHQARRHGDPGGAGACRRRPRRGAARGHGPGPPGPGPDPPRQAQIEAGIPKGPVEDDVNKVCASGIRAGLIDTAIRAGDLEIGVGGGWSRCRTRPTCCPARGSAGRWATSRQWTRWSTA